MKKNRVKQVIIGACCAMVLMCAAMVITYAEGQNAEPVLTLDGSGLEELYELDSVLSIPKATMSIGNDTKECEAYIIKPDNTLSYSQVVRLDMAGTYTLCYYAEIDGKMQMQTKKFSVSMSDYDVDGDGYCTYYESYEAVDGIPGIEVNLYTGDTFVYNRLIDVEELTIDEDICLLNVIPSSEATFDFEKINVYLSDAEDRSKYVQLRVQKDPAANMRKEEYLYSMYGAWALAGTNEQPVTAKDGSQAGNSYKYGEYIKCSMCGILNGDATLKDHALGFAMDYQNKTVYCTTLSQDDVVKIVDLDDDTVVSNMWDGFPSGKAVLSISVEGLNVSSAKLFIWGLLGYDFSNPGTSITESEVVIKLDEELVDEGIVGEKYYLHDAQAHDLLLQQDYKVTKAVYRNYYSNNRNLVERDEDSFVPEKAGKYTVVYSCKDAYGEITEYVKDIVVLKEKDDISIEMQLKDSYKAGDVITLPFASCANTIGNYSETVSVLFEGKEVDLVENTFIPEKYGTYQAKYTVVDGAKRKATTTFDIVVNKNEGVVVYEQAFSGMTDYLVTGVEYELPTLTGYYFDETGKHATEAKVKVDGSMLEGQALTVEKEGIVSVSYVFEKDQTQVYTKNFQAVSIMNSTDELMMTKLFYPKNAVVGTDKEGYIKLTANGNAKVDYINKTVLSLFEVRFMVDNFNFDKLSFVVTDVKTGKNFAINFFVEDDSLKFRINEKGRIGTVFKIEENKEITCSYNRVSRAVEVNGVSIDITTFADGTAFEGLTRGLGTLSVQFQGAKATTLVMKTLDGQSTQQITEDLGKPQIGFNSNYGGKVSLDDVVTLPVVVAGDLVSPIIDVKLSVKTPSGDYVKDQKGLVLNDVANDNYSFALKEYGEYIVSYRAVDTNGNFKDMAFRYTVRDEEAPKIKLTGKYATSVKANKEVKLAEYVVSDNLTTKKKIEVAVYIADGTGKIVRLDKNATSYTFDKVGIYTITYLVKDEAGNLKQVNYQMRVK